MLEIPTTTGLGVTCLTFTAGICVYVIQDEAALLAAFKLVIEGKSTKPVTE